MGRPVAAGQPCSLGSGRIGTRRSVAVTLPVSKRTLKKLPSMIALPCFPQGISQSQISASETAGTVLPCVPSAASCDGRLARQPEHFVGAE